MFPVHTARSGFNDMPSAANLICLSLLRPVDILRVRSLRQSWKVESECESLWRPIVDGEYPEAGAFVVAGCVDGSNAMHLYLHQLRLNRTVKGPVASDFKVVLKIDVDSRCILTGCFSWQADAEGTALVIDVSPREETMPVLNRGAADGPDKELDRMRVSMTVIRQADKCCNVICRDSVLTGVGKVKATALKWQVIKDLLGCEEGCIDISLQNCSWGDDWPDLLGFTRIGIRVVNSKSDPMLASHALAAIQLGLFAEWVK